MHHGKEKLEQLVIADLRRVIGYPHRFGVPGFARAYLTRGRRVSADGKPGDSRLDALHVVVDRFDTPVAPAREDRGLLVRGGIGWVTARQPGGRETHQQHGAAEAGE